MTKKRSKSTSHLGKVIAVIPDVQTRPGVPNDHLQWVGNYLADKRPDLIVQIGDFADMPSLNSYTLGKAAAEGTRYANDIKAAHESMEKLMKPIRAVKNYRPEMVLTLGNHETRIDREAEANPKLIGTISSDDLKYEKWGWKVYPFLSVAKRYGWEFSHYFVSGSMGRPVTSAAALLKIRQCSAVMGHVQKSDIAIHPQTGHMGIFAGLCALHDEDYLNPQGNICRRQIIFLHEVHEGLGDPMLVSLNFLKLRYS